MDRIKLVSIILISVLVGAVLVLIGFSFVAGDFFDTSSMSVMSIGKSQKNVDSETKDSENVMRMLKYQNKEYGFEFEFPDTYFITENQVSVVPLEFPTEYQKSFVFDITSNIIRLDSLEDNNTRYKNKDGVGSVYGNPVYFFLIKKEQTSELLERLEVDKERFFEKIRSDAIKCREDFSSQLDESELLDKCSDQVFGGSNYSTTTVAGTEVISVQTGDGGGSRSFLLLPAKGIAIGPFDDYHVDNPWRHKHHKELIDSLKRSLIFIDQ